MLKDAAIAYRLQKEYLKQEQILEQQLRAQQQSQQRSRNQQRPQASGMNNDPTWNFQQGPVNNQQNQQYNYSQNQGIICP